MLSKPIASGAMLVVLVGAIGGAVVQQNAAAPEAGVAEVEAVDTADLEATEPASSAPAGGAEIPAEPVAEEQVADVAGVDEAPEAEPERTASAPDRVVDTAGFPTVSDAERAKAVNPAPIVTVNGRPLGAPEETVAADDPAPAEAPLRREGDREAEIDVAGIEPPLPQPRPDNLPVRQAEPEIDYDAIAEAAYGERNSAESGVDIVPYERRDRLAPIPDAPANRDPSEDELVGVVGPNGEVIWVYEEQVNGANSRVTVQRPQRQNPFGFVYEEFDFRW